MKGHVWGGIGADSRSIAISRARGNLAGGRTPPRAVSPRRASVRGEPRLADQSMLRPWKEVNGYDWGASDFHFTADGAFLRWIEEGQVYRLEVATAEVTMIETDFELVW